VVAARHRADGARALRRSRLRVALAAAGLCLVLPAPAAQAVTGLAAPARYDRPPAGWTRSASEVLRATDALPEVRRARAGRRLTYRRAYLADRERRRWQVSYFAPPGRRDGDTEEIAQVIVADRSGRVLERWTGIQVAWTMARGYPGAFGQVLNSPWIWIPLCIAFVIPFARPPLRLLHLDLAVLLAFSVSYAYFNSARIDASVPLAYPPLVYLLVRMLALAFARSRDRSPAARPPLRLAVPLTYLVVATVFLVGFRIALNITNSNVIDVGYASVVGADRLAAGEPVYGGFPADIPRGDTYGPVTYYAYVPFEQLAPWRGGWDELPAAHAAALAFDLLCVALLWLLGRRLRGPVLGALLAYAWVSFPFTLLVADTNANDGLVALLVLAALFALGLPVARGAAVAAAGLAKFAPLALGPLLASYRGGSAPGVWSTARADSRAAALTAAGFASVAALALAPLVLGGDLGTFYDRTLAFQNDRGSPFSVWGLYSGIGGLHTLVKAAVVALAVLVAFVPRRRDVVTVAALGAAVLIAVQLALSHWFYLYVVWFAPLVLVALLAPYAEPSGSGAGRSTDSIESARPGAEQRISTALSHGSSSAAS
jgi:hypothetical protein